MQDFAHRQNAFMKHAMETGNFILFVSIRSVLYQCILNFFILILDECAGMEWQDEEEEVLEKEYVCSICNITSPSTESNPIGLVVLLQVNILNLLILFYINF